MLHLYDQPFADPRPEAYAEAVSRLAGVRHALRLVAPDAGPSDDLDDSPVAAAWDEAGSARQRWFDRRSERLVSATVEGVESLAAAHQSGALPHREASQALTDQIRRELAEVARVILA
jgi:hypothetical protein